MQLRQRAVFLQLAGSLAAALAVLLTGCVQAVRPGDEAYTRKGDEIMVCGRLFHTGAPVVLWTDPGGYDAYRTEKRFAPWDKAAFAIDPKADGPASPNRYGLRSAASLPPDVLARVRGGGWDLPTLRSLVNQFVIHYDVCGTSRQCFRVLHDIRGLSVHFMLDLDGTIYQTLDLKERAWHGGTANDRSIGIEIANIGAYAAASARPGELPAPLGQWYAPDPASPSGWRVTLPQWMGDGGLRTPEFIARPRRGPVTGAVHGTSYVMFDLTPQQFESLTKLTAALGAIFPGMPLDCPRGPDGAPRTTALSTAELAEFRGVLGHLHVTGGKIDPGPAFDWDGLLAEARRLQPSATAGAAGASVGAAAR